MMIKDAKGKKSCVASAASGSSLERERIARVDIANRTISPREDQREEPSLEE